MTVHADWSRWIELSVLKHVNDNLTGYHVFFEGAERKTSEHANWFEVRFDGPFYREVSRNYYKVVIEVNVLVAAAIARQIDEVSKMTGLAANVLDRTIGIFKLGPSPTDDQSQIGCLYVDTSDDKFGIATHKFGQIEPKVKLQQASVEVRYYAHLST